MKKLVIAAAVAVTAGVASAALEAQVYDMQLKVKTTTCKAGKLTKAIADLGWFGGTKGDEVWYRQSTTKKMAGIIWGCKCETIARPSWTDRLNTKTGKHSLGGYVFWDQTNSKQYIPLDLGSTSFDWMVFNRVAKMGNVEGTWFLADWAPAESVLFVGAGFGSATLDTSNDCYSHVKTMTGNFAGVMESIDGDNGCVFCGSDGGCLVAPFCVCEGSFAGTMHFTAAYGSWQIKYNSSASKKLEKSYYITQVRNFNSEKVEDLKERLSAMYQALTGNKVPVGGYVKAAKDDYDESKVKHDAGKVKKTVYKMSKDDTVRNKYYALLKVEAPAKSTFPTVLEQLFNAIGHVEAARAAEESDFGDDDFGGDDGGDDFGDFDF